MNYLQNSIYELFINAVKDFRELADKERVVDKKESYQDGYNDGIRFCVEKIENYAEYFKKSCMLEALITTRDDSNAIN